MNPLNQHSVMDEESDLHWRAFRYVSGEMSDNEAATFEELLAADQSAREAVASAVQVTEAVLAVTPAHVSTPVVSPRRNSWRERVAWMVLGASAACVVVFASWEFGSPRFGGDVALSPEQASEVHRVVAMWSAGNVLATEGFDVASDVPVEDDTELVARGPLHDVQVPGWMLAAVCPPNDENGPEDN